MFLETFQTTFKAILELVLVGAVGFLFVKGRIVREEGLKMLSDLVIVLFLPLLMFSQIIQRFSFTLYPDWWFYPILSVLISIAGFTCGLLAMGFDKSLRKNQDEFAGVVTFQNSGYLPIPLVASLLPLAAQQDMFIYLFLFLLGFNMTIFSFGVFLLHPKNKEKRFDVKNILNAPVIATLLALGMVFFKVNNVLPEFVSRPIESLGRCAIPLSILVVGGGLASLKTSAKLHWKPLSYALVIKLVLLPLIFLGIIMLIHPKPLVGLLILIQAAMPPAALLAVISKSQNHSDHLINQSIFYGHLAAIVTIPLFLVLLWIATGTLF